ncbi:lycopene cyclase family protein [Demequina mangrovi]|uniref:Lycopene beta-cyclase n=1 Tax=Demequina mangrovi TaxID=1043493 RepID=A0A1H6YFT9_9MICO|nr:lycopene cyclase family protein [Demequina mangrovi]SEJ37877.1 lycopene beta-cyclase [Demequina mangrovi]
MSPVTVERADAVIIGGGAAGLSLLCHLAAAGWGEHVVLIDDGARPVEHRSWAWWSEGRGLLDPRASVAYPHAVVADEGWGRRMDLAPYAYRVQTGVALASAADAVLAEHPRWRRIAGRAARVEAEGDGARVAVETDAGSLELRASRVFDSVRPGLPAADGPALDLLGLRVRTEAAVFDPGAVTLMDFRTPQEGGVAFVYVLPTSTHEALVERTAYTRAGETPEHEPRLARYLSEVLQAGAVTEVGRERGRIPLLAAAPAHGGGAIVPIGAAAGLVKASTGYAFARIQRHSEAIAARLAAGQDPGGAWPGSRWHRALDAALLRLIREDPDGARAVLGAMLRRNPPERILAFLDESASPLAQLRLFATLPEFARSMLTTLMPGAGAR